MNKLAPIFKQDNKLLTTEETAKRLGLKSHHTLEVWRCNKRYPELRYIKLGRLIRYRIEDINAFLASRTIGNDMA